MIWNRVTRRDPCVICTHDSWCGVSPDGRQAICMRVESDHPTRNGGWLHNLSGGNESGVTTSAPNSTGPKDGVNFPSAQNIDCEKLLNKWRQHQNGQLEPFAATLGVSQDALRALGCVWADEHRAFAFAMRNAIGTVIGIRLRNERGDKWAVKGSRQGLFGVAGMFAGSARESGSSAPHAKLLIVEGPTDAAAAIDLGYDVIGRPACLGCEEMIVHVVKTKQLLSRGVFIIADADEPGQRGARSLQAKLRKAKIVTLPAKDLRKFVQSGGTKQILDGILAASI